MGKKRQEHHGGAWKVAYADFVTAMMALFMVLWISAQEKEILLATSQYFQNPFNAPLDRSVGVMSGDGTHPKRNHQNDHPPTNMVDMAFLHNLANEFYRMLNIEEAAINNPIDIKVTSDGLRIVVFDRQNRPLFKPNQTDYTDWGHMVIQNLSWMVERHSFNVRIDAHVNQENAEIEENYGPWELSTDRANTVRRSLIHYALDPRKVERVTGFAIPEHAEEKEQRVEISLIVN